MHGEAQSAEFAVQLLSELVKLSRICRSLSFQRLCSDKENVKEQSLTHVFKILPRRGLRVYGRIEENFVYWSPKRWFKYFLQYEDEAYELSGDCFVEMKHTEHLIVSVPVHQKLIHPKHSVMLVP